MAVANPPTPEPITTTFFVKLFPMTELNKQKDKMFVMNTIKQSNQVSSRLDILD